MKLKSFYIFVTINCSKTLRTKLEVSPLNHLMHLQITSWEKQLLLLNHSIVWKWEWAYFVFICLPRGSLRAQQAIESSFSFWRGLLIEKLNMCNGLIYTCKHTSSRKAQGVELGLHRTTISHLYLFLLFVSFTFHIWDLC